MIHELAKTYDPGIEERIYDKWLDKNSMKKTIMFDNAGPFLKRISA